MVSLTKLASRGCMLCGAFLLIIVPSLRRYDWWLTDSHRNKRVYAQAPSTTRASEVVTSAQAFISTSTSSQSTTLAPTANGPPTSTMWYPAWLQMLPLPASTTSVRVPLLPKTTTQSFPSLDDDALVSSSTSLFPSSPTSAHAGPLTSQRRRSRASLEARAKGKEVSYSCHKYKGGQDDAWCVTAGDPYTFTEGQNEKYPGCGGCFCCKMEGVRESNAIVIMVQLAKTGRMVDGLLKRVTSCEWVTRALSKKSLRVILLLDTIKDSPEVQRALSKGRPFLEFVDMSEMGLWQTDDKYYNSSNFNCTTYSKDWGNICHYPLTYRLMCQFWTHGIFQVMQSKGVRYFMRLDADSDWTCHAQDPDPFKILRTKRQVYGYYRVIPDDEFVSIGVYRFMRKYVAAHNLDLRDTVAQRYDLINAVEGYGAWSYYNNFEVAYVPYFLQPQVQAFTDAVLESKFIIERRWGDAVMRFLQVALFSRFEQVHCFDNTELHYAHQGYPTSPCAPPPH